MDVRTVLLSVEERDKWRHRLSTLEKALEEVRSRKRRLERRLRSIRRQLARLTEISKAAVDPDRLRPLDTSHAAFPTIPIPRR